MPTSVDILTGILTVLKKIDTKIDKLSPSTLTGVPGQPGSSPSQNTQSSLFGGLGLSNFFGRGQAVDNKTTADAFASIVTSLKDLSSNKVKPKLIKEAGDALSGFFDVILRMSQHGQAVVNVSNMFDSLAKALVPMEKTVKAMSFFLLSIGASILLTAGSLFLAGKILSTTPVGAFGVIAGIVVAMIGISALIGSPLLGTVVESGAKTIKNMGIGFMMLAGGVLAFTLLLLLVPKVLGNSMDGVGLLGSVGMIAAIIAGITMMYVLIGNFSPSINQGTKTMMMMGLGLVVLSGSILVFGAVAAMLNGLAGLTSGKNGSLEDGWTNLLFGMGVAGTLIVGSIFLFQYLGSPTVQANIGLGLAAASGVAAGIVFLAGAVLAFTLVSSHIAKDLNSNIDDKGKAGLWSGLGVTGLIIGVATAAFVGLGMLLTAGTLGIGAGVLAAGIAGAIGVAIGLTSLAFSVEKFVNVSKSIGNFDVMKNVENLVGGTLLGYSKGVMKGVGLDESYNPFKVAKGIGSMMIGIALLKGVSESLSQFASGLTAFATLSSMRVIDSYDKNGKPVFGERVNIANVGTTIVSTITNFLTGIGNSTKDLTITKAFQIKTITNTLIGKNGILGGIIAFADTLKAFGEFGDRQEIGYIDFVDSGRIDPTTGQPIYTQERKGVPISTVVNSITGNISLFITSLIEGVERISVWEALKTRFKLSVLGESGPLSGINQFAQTLTSFAQFGANNMIPVFDKEGKSTGTAISVKDVATNISSSIAIFADIIAKGWDTDKVNAGKMNLGMYNFTLQLKAINELSTTADGITKIANSINLLATSILSLTTNMEAMNLSKIDELSRVAVNRVNDLTPRGVNNLATYKDNVDKEASSTSSNASVVKEIVHPSQMENINWDIVSKQIGESVAESLQNGQFVFTFAGADKGVLTLKR